MAAHVVCALLHDVGVVAGFMGPSPGEAQVRVTVPFGQSMVDELAPVIGAQTHQRERQASLDLDHRGDRSPVGAVLDHHVRGPPGEHIGRG